MLGVEVLDDPRADPALVRRTLRDIVTLNRLFGGTSSVLRALERIFAKAGRRDGGCGMRWTLLDVGTGTGDIPAAAARLARRYGIDLVPIGLDSNPTAARVAREGGLTSILADGGALPFGPRSVDIVIVSQVLHHLPRAAAVAWIAALDRIARRAVVLADLRRSRLAMAGLWLAALPLGFHPVTRHDAILSLRRGYTRAELEGMIRDAGVKAPAYYRPIARIVASWEPVVGSRSAVVGRHQPTTDHR